MKEFLSSVQKNSTKYLFLLTILLLPVQLGKHFWPSFAFVLGQRIDYLSPTLYLSDVSKMLLFLFSLPLLGKKIIPFLPFLLVCAVGVVFATNPAGGWFGLGKLVEMIAFGICIAAYFPLYTKTIVKIMMCTLLFESLLTIIQVIHGGSLNGIFYFLGERMYSGQTPGVANASVFGQLILRPYATFPHPNVLAGFLVVMGTIVWNFMNVCKGKYGRGFVVIALLVTTIALFLTLSRITILAWIGVGIFYFIKTIRKENKKTKQQVVFFISLFLLLFLLVPSTLGRFIGTSFFEESIVVREQLSLAAFQMFFFHPLFGVGLQNFYFLIPNFYHSSSLFAQIQPVHNIFLVILSQTGLAGTLFVSYFLYKTWKKVHDSFFETSHLPFLLFALLFLLGFFDHYFVTLQQGQMLSALILGICWSNRGEKA